MIAFLVIKQLTYHDNYIEPNKKPSSPKVSA